jgi:hypothetical protein
MVVISERRTAGSKEGRGHLLNKIGSEIVDVGGFFWVGMGRERDGRERDGMEKGWK